MIPPEGANGDLPDSAFGSQGLYDTQFMQGKRMNEVDTNTSLSVQ
jgi:hypothetical protein